MQQAQLQKRIKVWEAVDLWAAIYRKAGRLRRTVCSTQLGLADKRNAWFMTLSGGQKQRLFIALALINDPEVVFLDELTTGLDPQARHAIWDLVRGIRERGKTVFLTTHSDGRGGAVVRPRGDHRARAYHRYRQARGIWCNRHCPERSVILATDDPNAAERFRSDSRKWRPWRAAARRSRFADAATTW